MGSGAPLGCGDLEEAQSPVTRSSSERSAKGFGGFCVFVFVGFLGKGVFFWDIFLCFVLVLLLFLFKSYFCSF